MRLALVISSLAMGGAERVFSLLANGLAARGHAIALFTLDDGAIPPFYALDERIRRVPLGLAGRSTGPVGAACANLRRIAVLRRAILAGRPDAALSFMDATNVLTLLAAGRRLPVAVSERVHPAHADGAAIWSLLKRRVYALAAAVVVQTPDAATYFPPAVRARCRVLPNPARPPADAPAPEFLRGRTGPLLLGMGRLHGQKGFDILLDAFAGLSRRFPDWTLAVLGEGPERAALERRRDALGLAGRAIFPGALREPGGALRRADVFVLSSRYEGFPNALLEAMACGAPAVACDCPSGPAEIVRDGVDGLLVPPGDAAALAEALGRIMGDAALRRSLAARAPEVLERFAPDKILDGWEALLEEIRSGKRRSGRGGDAPCAE